MDLLHKHRQDFIDAVSYASEKYGMLPEAIEKDYYVTLILKRLSEKLDYIVFKGGTSLSKCHKVIKRFSEDIDITIDRKLSQGQMKKLKKCIKEIAEELELQIPNIDNTRSRRSYNRYILEYDSVLSGSNDVLKSAVLMETSFAEVSFPTVVLPVHSYIGDIISEEAPELLQKYMLDSFEMKVQDIDRTLVDKVFAICDYYLQGKVKRHSRHIYDIYKLLEVVSITDEFVKLIKEVRSERAKTNICPSAQNETNISELLKTIIDTNVYKEDYDSLTIQLLEEPIDYEIAIEAVRKIAESRIF